MTVQSPPSVCAGPTAKACPVCGGHEITDGWTLGTYQWARCRICSHAFIRSGFHSSDLEQAYEEDYYHSSAESESKGYVDYLAKAPQRIRGFEQRLSQLERFAPGRRSLLDFGCAVGLFVKVARDAGWEAVGLERSLWAANYGRSQLGLTIYAGNEPECAGFGNRFDVITMWDVLEHLEDPHGVLKQLARWLKPGGLMALNTVDSASRGARLAGEHWRHIAPPHHLQYFTRESLKRLLHSTGFRLLTVQSQGVMWGADRRRTKLSTWRALGERALTHWRFRGVAHLLQLLDEVEIFAVRDDELTALDSLKTDQEPRGQPSHQTVTCRYVTPHSLAPWPSCRIIAKPQSTASTPH